MGFERGGKRDGGIFQKSLTSVLFCARFDNKSGVCFHIE